MRALTLVLLSALLSLRAYSQASAKPNILIIMADDLTFSDIEPYGSTQVHTPNISKLAKEGICIDNMFTSTAMCAPTRQQFMTGLYPVRNGAYPNHSEVYPGTRSIAHYMKELGYNAALLGKKHYGPHESFPFDYLGGRDGDNGKGQDINLEIAETYIQKSDKPFFLMVTPNQPHTPWTRGNPLAYPPEKIKVPLQFEDTPLTRKNLSKYFAEITYLDSLVGVCLDVLEKTGKKNNTLVIFTTEQGSQMPFGKWTCYDRGLRTGFIARWPGKIKPFTRTQAMAQYVDVVPTLIDIAGGKPEAINSGNKDAAGYSGLDGKSFRNVLTGEADQFRDYVFGVHTTRGIIKGSKAYGIRSARSNEFLYIHNLNFENKFTNVLTNSELINQWKKKNANGRALLYELRPEEELYNIKSDPHQLVNLAEKPEMDAIRQQLKSKLAAFMKQQGDKGTVTEMKAKERQHAGAGD